MIWLLETGEYTMTTWTDCDSDTLDAATGAGISLTFTGVDDETFRARLYYTDTLTILDCRDDSYSYPAILDADAAQKSFQTWVDTHRD